MREYRTTWINNLSEKERRHISVSRIQKKIEELKRMLQNSGQEAYNCKLELRDLVGLLDENRRLNRESA